MIESWERIIISKRLRDKIINFESMNERIRKNTGNYQNLTLITVYGPKNDKYEEKNRKFYEILERVYI